MKKFNLNKMESWFAVAGCVLILAVGIPRADAKSGVCCKTTAGHSYAGCDQAALNTYTSTSSGRGYCNAARGLCQWDDKACPEIKKTTTIQCPIPSSMNATIFPDTHIGAPKDIITPGVPTAEVDKYGTLLCKYTYSSPQVVIFYPDVKSPNAYCHTALFLVIPATKKNISNQDGYHWYVYGNMPSEVLSYATSPAPYYLPSGGASCRYPFTSFTITLDANSPSGQTCTAGNASFNCK